MRRRLTRLSRILKKCKRFRWRYIAKKALKRRLESEIIKELAREENLTVREVVELSRELKDIYYRGDDIERILKDIFEED